MFFATRKLLRRYTPPTCTLELWVTRSRFRPFLKAEPPQDWQFELRFDDPRMPEEHQLALKGDRQQLDSLYEVVGHYLQNFLQETRSLWTVGASSEKRSFPEQLNAPVEGAVISSTQPCLHSQGLLSHELQGGSLAEIPARAIVTLSTSQLFDLSHALDDYQRDLPDLLQPKSAPLKSTHWLLPGGMAIALGLLGLIWGQQRWHNWFAPTASNSITKPNPASPPSYLSAVPPVPLPPVKPIPAPSLAPTLANRDPLPMPSPATPDDPLARSADNPLQNPGLRVLPPPPVAPPAPPLPAGATSTVGLNPLGTGAIQIPEESSDPYLKVSPLKKLPSPPPLLPNNSNTAFSTRAAPESNSPQAPLSDRPLAQTRLLDTIPQVAEVRAYFQKRWQKPADLTQSLEYRLSIKPNGSLAKIVPLGKAAIIYQPKVGMPAIGEVFVSPLPQKEDQTIRLVLDLEGKVSTFLE